MSRIVSLLASGLALTVIGSTAARADTKSGSDRLELAATASTTTTYTIESTHPGKPKLSLNANATYAVGLLPQGQVAAKSAAMVSFNSAIHDAWVPASSSGLMGMVPRLGSFALTFYSDIPASGFDGMYNADVVVSLTRKF